jgi:hypothetical protein
MKITEALTDVSAGFDDETRHEVARIHRVHGQSFGQELNWHGQSSIGTCTQYASECGQLCEKGKLKKAA